MQADWIVPDDPRWASFLEEAPHDFYHLPSYVAFSARHEGGEPVAFHAEDGRHRMLAPLVLRRLPQNLGAPERWRDASTPYGYPCPLLSPGCDDVALERFLGGFVESGRKRDIVSVFFRLNPLLPLPADALSSTGVLVPHGQTVYVDLRASREDIWRQTRSGHRTEIRKLQRLGYRVVMDDWDLYDKFMSIYTATMARLEASDFYFFGQEYFRGLRRALGDDLHLGSVLSPTGELAAAGLFASVNGLVQYHLSGADERYRKAAPTKLMLDFVRWWAKDSGCHYLHLAGGLGAAADSLFEFKAGFSKLRAEFHTLRITLDADRYGHLVRLWESAHPGDTPAPDFFPAYRS